MFDLGAILNAVLVLLMCFGFAASVYYGLRILLQLFLPEEPERPPDWERDP